MLHRVAAPILLATALAVGAQPSATQLERLGRDLTPVGAERAGNADGTIPPWTGGLPRTAIDTARGYVDPYADDPVLFTIDAANAAAHRQQLSDGHLALLQRQPQAFRMNVYATRRSASWPDAVLAEVKKQAPLARADGDRLLDVGKSAVPFPIPADAMQIMWNHTLRWRGGSVRRQFVWAPVAAAGRYFVVRVIDAVAFDQQGYMLQPRPNRLFNWLALYLAPTPLEGQLTLVWEPLDPQLDSRVTWVYEPALRRVRRSPSLEHDDLDPRTQGLRTSDQYDGWNGAPDLYEWKLVGKRELYIPYNSYKLADRSLKYEQILQPGYVRAELLRYELHRVWVIEATLRAGQTHRYARRVFYLDEDTWQVAMEEDYDAAGMLWRFGNHPALQFYDVQVPWYAATIHYDFKADAYLASYLSNQERLAWSWGWFGDISDFMPGNLRRLGTR